MKSAQDASQPQTRKALTFIVLTAFIDSLGIGLALPVIPTLLIDLTGSPLADAAVIGGIATFAYASMQFIFSPIIGALSDRFGRRPVLLVSLVAFALDNLLLGLSWSIVVFLVARTLAGVFAATYSTANAYISDVTPKDQRGQRFALIGAAFGAGFVIGPALGGLLGELSPRAPFFAAAGLALVNAAFGYFVLPETLSKAKRRAFSWRRANAIGTLSQLRGIPQVRPLLPVFLLATLAHWIYPAVWSFVVIAKFGWSEWEIGLSIAFYGVISILSQVFVVRALLPRLGAPKALILAYGVQISALVGIAFATVPWVLYLFISFSLVASMQDPALRQLLSSEVDDNAQGELQGGLSSLQSIAMILSPLIYTQLFHLFTDGSIGIIMPGAPFIAASVFAASGLILFTAFQLRHRSQT